MPRRAADLLVDCLAAHGVDRVFCVPGESYLAALDALHDSNAIETVICRHEGGAGFAAIGDAKLTGRPGVAFVSRGPGATNASIAVHVAEQDAVPLVLFIGQVPRAEIGRRSFQEVDYAKTFADMAKGVYVIQDARAHRRDRGARLRGGADADARAGRGGAARGHAGGQRRGVGGRAAGGAARRLCRPRRSSMRSWHGSPRRSGRC